MIGRHGTKDELADVLKEVGAVPGYDERDVERLPGCDGSEGSDIDELPWSRDSPNSRRRDLGYERKRSSVRSRATERGVVSLRSERLQEFDQRAIDLIRVGQVGGV